MTKTYTITREQYDKINHGRIDFMQLKQKLKDVVHPRLLEQIEEAEKQMHEGLKPIFEQMQAEEQEWEDHVEQVEKLCGPFPNSTWSMREVPDLQAPHNFEGACVVSYREHWGKVPIRVEITGPLWVDLWRAANEAMKRSGDDHHFFIEAFSETSEPGVIELHTGS